MADTPATLFSDLMTNIQNNQGGGIQTLNNVNVSGGKLRAMCANIVLAAQASASVFGIARLPLGATFLGIRVNTDTSLATATIKFGNAHNGNSAIYGAAATLTSTDTITSFAPAAKYGQPITTGYDCVSGLATTYDNANAGGGGYEDIIMTTGVAALPGAGNLRIVVEYMID